MRKYAILFRVEQIRRLGRMRGGEYRIMRRGADRGAASVRRHTTDDDGVWI